MNPLRRLIPWPRRTKTARNATPAYTIAVVALTTDDQSKRLLSQFAVRGQWDLAFARTIGEALALLRTGQPAVLLCDRDLPDLDWRRFIEQVAGSRTGSAVILTSLTCDEYLWDETSSKEAVMTSSASRCSRNIRSAPSISPGSTPGADGEPPRADQLMTPLRIA
jgi:hypothetical protein